MKERIELLESLICMELDIYETNTQLNKYEWDCEIPLLSVNKKAVFDIFNRYLDRKVSAKQLVDWANFIECREDIEFECEQLQEIIFEIANCEINTPITDDYISSILDNNK